MSYLNSFATLVFSSVLFAILPMVIEMRDPIDKMLYIAAFLFFLFGIAYFISFLLSIRNYLTIKMSGNFEINITGKIKDEKPMHEFMNEILLAMEKPKTT